MFDAVNNSPKQRGRPFNSGVSGNPRGRPKGSRNRRTSALIEAAQSGGETPLDYMLRVMRDPKAPAKRRDEMARAAAPFLHSKLSAVEHSGSQEKPVASRLMITFRRPESQPDD
jgi:hypothetical protein